MRKIMANYRNSIRGLHIKTTMIIAALAVIVFLFSGPAEASYKYGNYSGIGYFFPDFYPSHETHYLALKPINLDNVRIIALAFKIGRVETIRGSLYIGDAITSEANKVYDSGLLAHNTYGWQEFPLAVPYDLPKNTKFLIGYRGNNNCYFGEDLPNDNAGFIANNSAGPPPTEVFPDSLSGFTYGPFVAHKQYIVYVLYPTISTVTPATIVDNQSGIIIEGTGFEGLDEFGASTSHLWLTQNNDWNNPGFKVPQTVTAWNNTQIAFTSVYQGLSGPTAYLWVENSDGEINSSGYPVTINSFDSSPPDEVAGSLSITPQYGVYTAGTHTITEQFNDPDSRIYACEYSIDNSNSWKAGAISGTGPYTCTSVDSTAADGTVINVLMRALSVGGTSSPSAKITRTVDAVPPVSGVSFTAVPNDSQCSLTWAATTDTVAGMHVVGPYEIRWQEGSDPGDCTGGNQLFSGTGASFPHVELTNATTYYYRLCYKDNLNNQSGFTGNPVICETPKVILADGTQPKNKPVRKSSVNQAVSSFTLNMNNNTDTVTSMTVTGTNTGNTAGVKIYKDNGSVVNEYDSGDTLMAAAAFIGSEAIFNGLNIPVTSSTVQYIITYDFAGTAIEGAVLTGYVSTATAHYPVVNGDNTDAILTVAVDDVAPVTTDNTPAAWQSNEIIITLTPNDGSGTGVTASTGIYGCLGSGCTPVVLGTNTMTTLCGSGNECAYNVRYYSVDNIGNIEALKTGVNQARVDRKPPGGGTFTSYGGNYQITQTWNGITDTGSGLALTNRYKLLRVIGAIPPANCTSGTLIYQGTNTFYQDGAENGQPYSYRLCVYDVVGNVASNYISTVSAQQCTSVVSCDACHGTGEPPSGGSKILPRSGHTMHGNNVCGDCHREGAIPSHVDGNITINTDSGWNMGADVPWPNVLIGGSCGGQWNPVGGQQGNPMGCHSTGTSNYPGLTPQWECIWDENRVCIPSP